mgnify:FL=1|jgi:hypothetical protein
MGFNPRDPDEVKGLVLAVTLLIFAVVSVVMRMLE